MRIIVCGASKTGKTTLGKRLAKKHGIPLLSTDSLIGQPREKEIAQIVQWLDQDNYVVEGWLAVHGLREYHRRNPDKLCPADEVHMLTRSKQELTDAQANQRKGVLTVFNQIKHWLDDTTNLKLEQNRENVLWDFSGEQEDD